MFTTVLAYKGYFINGCFLNSSFYLANNNQSHKKRVCFDCFMLAKFPTFFELWPKIGRVMPISWLNFLVYFRRFSCTFFWVFLITFEKYKLAENLIGMPWCRVEHDNADYFISWNTKSKLHIFLALPDKSFQNCIQNPTCL